MGEATPPLLQDDEARGAGGTGASPLPAVSMRQITKRFPGVLANDRVDFDAEVGEVHALLGENGAGKTTLMNVLAGLYRPDDGEIELDGRPVRFDGPRDAIEAGIGMVHQHFRLVQPLTVTENVLLGWHTPRFWLDQKSGRRQIREVSETLGMRVDPDARIWQLSVGEQQRVEIVKAVFRGSHVLVLDEPTAVLTPQEAEGLFETLRLMAREGHSVIVITHKLHEVMAVADRVTVLRAGAKVATVPAAGSTQRSLAALMVGREIAADQRLERTTPVGDVMLEVQDVRVVGDRGGLALKGVSLEVRAGEIVAVAGVAGNGQRELAEAVAGVRDLESGAVRVAGHDLRSGDPRSAIAAGVAYVPEDRLGTGLAPSLSVATNAALKSYRARPLSRGPLLLLRRVRDLAVSLMRRYDVQAPGPDTPVRNLSGGNLQKLVLGREFEGEPRVLVAGQPTRGLDVGAIETVHAHLREAAKNGLAVLMVSEDLEEILALADRVLVMYEGEVRGEVDARTATIEEIGFLMAGGEA